MRSRSMHAFAGLTASLILVAAACGGQAPVGGGGAPAAKAFIPMISKGFQHQFWQAVKQGAEINRPSTLLVDVGDDGEVSVGGGVRMVGEGVFDLP